MKLMRKNSINKNEYLCDLTLKLDKLCGFTNHTSFRNYLLYTEDCSEHSFAIRIPGRTTGTITTDENGNIIKCSIDSDLIGTKNIYPEQVNDVLSEFVGINLEF